MSDTQILMNELKPMLEEIAVNDLAAGKDIYDHPCSVAIRIIEHLEKGHEADVRQISYMKKLLDNKE